MEHDYRAPNPVDPKKKCGDCGHLEDAMGVVYDYCNKHEMIVNSLGTCSHWEDYPDE